LSFSGADDCITQTPTNIGTNALYVRIKVINEKPRLARACRAYLTNIETKSGGASFKPTNYVDSIQLAWSCQPLGDERRPLDLPNGVSQYIDVVATDSATNTFIPQIGPPPLRYIPLFTAQPETFRFTVQVSGDGVDPEVCRVVFVWKGKWDDIEAYEDKH